MSTFLPLLEPVLNRVQPPVLFVSGGARILVDLINRVLPQCPAEQLACYQMDVYQAERLRGALAGFEIAATVHTLPDLWDVPGRYRTLIYAAPAKGERELKIDLVEQAYHVLEPGGLFLTLSPHVGDTLFPKLLKKVFGKTGMWGSDEGTTFANARGDDQPRRRHELAYRAHIGTQPPVDFLSRPGVFSYGRLDEGTRALAETMEIQPGERVLDIGCGVGALGVFAMQHAGLDGKITFVDSNTRAIALTEHNAAGAGLTHFECLALSKITTLPGGMYDVALANPPYFAQESIARGFVEGAYGRLRKGGRLLLVTKMPNEVGPIVAEVFGDSVVMWQRRGYTIFEGIREDKHRRGPVRD